MEPISFERDTIYRYYISDPQGRSFSTGFTSQGEQTIVGILFPEIVWLLFDQDGSLTAVNRKPFWDEGRSAQIPVPVGVDRAALAQRQCDLGLRPGTISVKKFAVPELEVGIEDIPGHFLDAITSPSDFDPDEATQLQENARRWMNEGRFVFHWGTDYWMDKDGNVVAS